MVVDFGFGFPEIELPNKKKKKRKNLNKTYPLMSFYMENADILKEKQAAINKHVGNKVAKSLLSSTACAMPVIQSVEDCPVVTVEQAFDESNDLTMPDWVYGCRIEDKYKWPFSMARQSFYTNEYVSLANNKLMVVGSNVHGSLMRPTFTLLSWDDLPPKQQNNRHNKRVEPKSIYTAVDMYGFIKGLDESMHVLAATKNGKLHDIDLQQRSQQGWYIPDWWLRQKEYAVNIRAHIDQYFLALMSNHNILYFLKKRPMKPHSKWRCMGTCEFDEESVDMLWFANVCLVFLKKSQEFHSFVFDFELIEKNKYKLKKFPMHLKTHKVLKVDGPKTNPILSLQKWGADRIIAQRKKKVVEEYKVNVGWGAPPTMELVHTVKSDKFVYGYPALLHPTRHIICTVEQTHKGKTNPWAFLVIDYNDGKLLSSCPHKVNFKGADPKHCFMFWENKEIKQDCATVFAGYRVAQFHPKGLNRRDDHCRRPATFYYGGQEPCARNWGMMDNTNIPHDHRQYEMERKDGMSKGKGIVGQHKKYDDEFLESRDKIITLDNKIKEFCEENPKALEKKIRSAYSKIFWENHSTHTKTGEMKKSWAKVFEKEGGSLPKKSKKKEKSPEKKKKRPKSPEKPKKKKDAAAKKKSASKKKSPPKKKSAPKKRTTSKKKQSASKKKQPASKPATKKKQTTITKMFKKKAVKGKKRKNGPDTKNPKRQKK